MSSLFEDRRNAFSLDISGGTLLGLGGIVAGKSLIDNYAEDKRTSLRIDAETSMHDKDIALKERELHQSAIAARREDEWRREQLSVLRECAERDRFENSWQATADRLAEEYISDQQLKMTQINAELERERINREMQMSAAQMANQREMNRQRIDAYERVARETIMAKISISRQECDTAIAVKNLEIQDTQMRIDYLERQAQIEREAAANEREEFRRGAIVMNFEGTRINGVYRGETLNELPFGKGAFYYDDRRRYIGDFVNSMFDGEGTFNDERDQLIYTGQWRNGRYQGRGRLSLGNNRYCVGDFDAGRIKFGYVVNGIAAIPDENSIVVMTYLTDDAGEYFYEGSLKDGKPNGYGKKIYSSGRCEEGVYCNGLLSEFSIVTTSDGTYFEGLCENGIYSGLGRQKYADGSLYEGEYKNGEPNGHGRMAFSNGHIYEGEFKSGKITGEGVFIRQDALPISGQWVDGQLLGEINFNDGTIYVGEVHNGDRIGHGRIFISKKEFKEALWDRDKIKDLTYSYHGQIKDRDPDGKGTIVFPNNITVEAMFQAGEMQPGCTIFRCDAEPFVVQYYDKPELIVLRLNDGTVYKGEVLKGMRHGNGLTIFGPEDIQYGIWQEDKLNEIIYEYHGQLCNDTPAGKGSLTLGNGTKIDGVFENEVLVGHGTITYNDGSTYVGRFVRGKRNGYGEYVEELRTYTGNWADDYLEGEGVVLEYIVVESSKKDEKVLISKKAGQWKNGKLEGKGKWEHYNTNISQIDEWYEGDWHMGMKQGVGEMHYVKHNVYGWPESEDVYSGEWYNDMRHGKGCIKEKVRPCGGYESSCEAVWVNGLRQGMGRVESNHGAEIKFFYYTDDLPKPITPEVEEINFTDDKGITGLYTGEIIDGKPNGSGTFVFEVTKNGVSIKYTCDGRWQDGKISSSIMMKCIGSNGQMYEGGWVDNAPFGTGKMTWPDGRTYSGEWRFGRQNGTGIMSWPDGRIYDGRWDKGKPSGGGKMTWPDGRVYVGKWQEGKICGRGKMAWSDGAVYEGEWHEGKICGHGKKTYSDGRIYEGDWSDGKQSGNCKMKWPDGRVYEGLWHNGTPNGNGKMCFPNGQIFECIWKDGSPKGMIDSMRYTLALKKLRE